MTLLDELHEILFATSEKYFNRGEFKKSEYYAKIHLELN